MDFLGGLFWTFSWLSGELFKCVISSMRYIYIYISYHGIYFHIFDMYMIYEFHNTIIARVSKRLLCNVRRNPKADAEVWRNDETQNGGQL